MAEVLEIEEPLQDDPPRKKLYKGLVSKGLYTKSYQDFEGQFSTPESIGKLYKNMYDKGLYTKTDKDFTSQFFSETPKKKENFNSPIQSSGEVGGEFGKTKTVQEPFDPLKQQKKIFTGLNKEPTDTFQLESVGEPVSRKPITPRVMTLEEYSKTLDKTPVADQTQIDKPLSEIEIKEQIKRGEQHKKNVGIAIDNTVKQYFKLKGIKTGTNSQLYQEQKEKLQKAYEDGEVSYHMDLKTNTPRLDKVTGFWENISKGWNAAMDANDEAATFVHDMNTQDRVNFIKQKQAEQLKQQENLGAFIGEREGGAGWLGHTVGGAAPFLAKAGLGALTGAALLAAAPETMGASLAAAPVAFSFLYTAPDMANQGAMNETLRRYEQIKKENPEMSDIDAMGQAESGMLTGGIAGITENALFMKTMKLPISNEGKQVIGKFATETLQSGMNMGTATAVTDVAKNIVSGMEGYKQPTRDIVKSAVNTFTENATVGMVLHGMISGVPKILNSAFKYSLKDTPKQEVTEILNNNVEAGTITPEQAKKVAEDIDGYNQALDKINPRGLSETSQASIAGLIQAKENLKKEAETKDESVRKPYEDKIEAISQQIADIQRTNKPFEHEIDDLTGNTLAKPSFDEVAKQRVQDVADKISKGKEVEDVIDIQTETKFPEQLETALNKILREEKSANKDKEKPNNEITNNIEKYLARNKKEEESKEGIVVEPPKEIPESIPLKDETKETEISLPPEKEILPEKRIIEETQGTAEPFTEEKRTILSHRGLQEVATEFALDDVTPRDRKTDPQLFKDAEQTATKWNNEGVYPEKIEGLVKKAEEAEVLTDEQRVILQQHIANVRGEISSMNITDPNYDARLQELNRLVRAGETTRSAAGAALRVPYMGSVPNDLPSMMVEEMRVSKTGELTTGQKETVQREYTDISRAEKAYQQKVEALEAENAKLRAGKKVAETKATTKPRKEHTDFVAERKKITESISDKLKKARQDTNVVIVPYAKELIAIAPDVAKLMKSYVEEGIVKLEDITKKIHDELKGYIPDLQEKDVHDIIAGKYNEKKRTKNEIAENIENIRLQAKLVNKLEDLYRGEEPKTEKLKIKRNAEIEKLRNEIKDIASFDKEVAAKKEAQLKSSEAKNKELEKELSKYESKTPKKKPEAEVLESLKLKMIKEAESLKEQIRTGNFEKVEKKEPLKLDSEALKLRDEVIKLRQNREVRLILQQRMNETGRQKGMRLAAEVLNVPRTLMTIGDFSGLLRQDIFFAAGHPKETLNAAKEMFKSGWSQKEYDRWYADLKETPRYPIMQKSKLSITDSINHDLTKREEDYMSSLSEKIPFLGKSIVKGSERSYTALLNQSRVTRFNEFADAMEARGITYDNNPKSYKAMAEYINNATGRSDFGETLNRVAPILNSVFFSPRLIASRVNMLSYWMQPRFWTNLPKEVRIDYMRNWISLLAIGGSILALSKMGGADVEDDPRSSDFGKIKSGNTRWDIWGGAQQYMRVLAQTISGQRKSTKSGKMYELNGDDIFGETRAGVVTDFFRNKLAPVPGSVVDILSGRTGVGDRIVYQWGGAGNKEISLDQYVKQRLLPMTITGTQEAMKDQGVKALFTVAIPSTFGVGTQTYGNENSTTKPVKKAQPKKPMKKVSKIEK